MEYMELNALENKIDVLNRDKFIDDVKNIILKLSLKQSSCSFAIDGTWGIGKTFVLEKLQNLLEMHQSEETNDDRYYVFYYNCWQYDYYDEPAIAIISAMLYKFSNELETKIKNTLNEAFISAKTTVTNIAGKFVENNIGINPVEVYSKVKSNNEERVKKTYNFDNMFSFKETLDYSRKEIEKLAKNKTIVIIVDELDRCMPSYAIKVLERLHHMFDEIKNVIVILAIDSSQLEHSVKEIYGDKVDTERYLKKFINFSVKLDMGQIQASVLEKYNGYFSKFNFDKEESVKNYIDKLIGLCKIDARNLDKIFTKLELMHNLVCKDEKVSSSILWFEIFTVFMQFNYSKLKNKINDISNYKEYISYILDFNNSEYLDVIGVEIVNLLTNINNEIIQDNIYADSRHIESYIIKNNQLGIATLLINFIFKKNKPFITYQNIEKMYLDLVNLCSDFSKMVDIIL